MIARMSNVSFPVGSLGMEAEPDVAGLFAKAVERRYVWLAIDDVPENLSGELRSHASDAGYSLWYSGSSVLAVREDLLAHGERAHLGGGVSDTRNTVTETTAEVDPPLPTS